MPVPSGRHFQSNVGGNGRHLNATSQKSPSWDIATTFIEKGVQHNVQVRQRRISKFVKGMDGLCAQYVRLQTWKIISLRSRFPTTGILSYLVTVHD
jgi:hypothetical protein